MLETQDPDPGDRPRTARHGRDAGRTHGAATMSLVRHAAPSHAFAYAAITVAIEPATLTRRPVASVLRRPALYRPVIFVRVTQRCFLRPVLRHVPRVLTRGEKGAMKPTDHHTRFHPSAEWTAAFKWQATPDLLKRLKAFAISCLG